MKLPMEVQQQLMTGQKPWRGNRVLGCFGIAIGAIIVLAIIGQLLPDKPKAEGTAANEMTVRLSSPLLCSKSLWGVGTVAQVRAAGDTEGVIGLVAREKALLLPAGTTVHVVNHDAETASVYVRSGALVGEDCWIQPGWITAATR